ncbi:hypothetical protein H9Q69_004018 [Fusarium xylarioides]|uniref:Helicase ATP-binding domain-containing protein n=1 Tax=Fusarium xylarioides TaxID=221167 RepID=A0A9P7I8C4_9HYPO|nr:hypothetical protein H9Q70_011113 [Fusarium xylarioides]KAG5764418.1 hypothetical protein H9Q72_007506 [Fusarium xylarioides]KAG5796975.1 hypothetical protein H9Q69_004018 [Fusarium xylarioides]KAG5802979.1 hypothetical protein H9Q71_012431 [Fusarium xylarioides]KAG5813960.1 hypothetical protein H9Q74_012474 [Fusarium xylarioides]
MIITEHDAPRAGRIPSLRYGNTLFEHQKHAVGAAMRSLAAPLKGMILGDPSGLGKALEALAVAALSWEPGDGPSLIVAPLSCCSQRMAEIDAFFDTDAIKYYNSYLTVLFPKRPKLVLRSVSLESGPWKPIGKCMILDEAHIIKNRNTRTFAAVTALRGHFEGCPDLTGTPLDNTWEHGYALPRRLEGYPITDFNILLQASKKLDWHVRVFALDPKYRSNSNSSFAELKWLMMMMMKSKKSQGLKSRGKAPQSKKADGAVQLKLAQGGLVESMRRGDVDDAIPDDLDAQALEQIAEWCQQLEQGDNSLSRRVQAILDTMRQHLDRRPDDSLIIVDESVWFPDMMAIALKKTYHSVAHDTYNGRLDTVQRHLTIKKISQATPPHTLLAGRGTGGQGLNMQFSKVVIRCGPWWKKM